MVKREEYDTIFFVCCEGVGKEAQYPLLMCVYISPTLMENHLYYLPKCMAVDYWPCIPRNMSYI